MRYPPGHKAEVHQRLVDAAVRLLLTDGFEGLSIPALMKRLGLTHGGFYRHFKGRDALVSEAALAAGGRTADRVFERTVSLEQTLGAYLSAEHVAHPELGCVLAATGSAARTQSPGVRATYSRIAVGFLQLLERKLHPPGAQPERAPARPLRGAQRAAVAGPPAVSDETLVLAAQMVGAVVLARLVHSPPLVARLLGVARRQRAPQRG